MQQKKGWLMDKTSNVPLHGITLEAILNSLLICYGWEGLAERGSRLTAFLPTPALIQALSFCAKHHGQGLKLKPFTVILYFVRIIGEATACRALKNQIIDK